MKMFRLSGVALLALQLAATAFADGAADTRAAFLAVIERPHVPANAELADLPPVDGLHKQHLWFQSDATERVPGYLLFPDAKAFPGKRPVVIALHGTGGNKENMSKILTKAAQAGFIGVAIDGRFHGERTRAGDGEEEYDAAIAAAFRTGKGHPFYYDTVWDVMRLIDYLATRDDIDPRRIGVIGFSKGGIETYLAAAADPRIAVAVPCIGVQSFRWALENNAWQSRVGTIQFAFENAARSDHAVVNAQFVRTFYDRLVPGIYSEFDGPAMLPLIAPRPLMVINGDSDSLTPIPGVMLAANSASEAYAKAGAKDKFVLRVEKNTGHSVNGDSLRAAIDWFVAWLKP
jgi:dienelactone hydrolase